MTQTTSKNCTDCASFRFDADIRQVRCLQGHSPRFYRPRADQQHLQGGGAWGWRRRCDDYEAKT